MKPKKKNAISALINDARVAINEDRPRKKISRFGCVLIRRGLALRYIFLPPLSKTNNDRV
jgi:hypothetical protein